MPTKKSRCTVDLESVTGSIRRLNGINLGPKLVNQTLMDFSDSFRELEIPYARLHDAPLDNPGIALVDTSLVFPRADAAPDDPGNYFFRATDDYIANCRACGTEVIYRLGVSIEHSINQYFAFAPADYAHYAEVCAAIVRHYNRGWGEGHEWEIRYWEIWNEPNLTPQMWDRDMDAYFELYAVVAKRLKREFPEIRIGGPALCWLDTEVIGRFLTYCKGEGAPLDFFSWHWYGREIESLVSAPQTVKALLEEHGFGETELHLNEWHYLPCSWEALRMNPETKEYFQTAPDGLNGIDAAAFTLMALTRWQDTALTLSNYYAAGLQSWGLWDVYGRPRKTWRAFKLFAELAREPNRLSVTGNTSSRTVLAAGDGKGNALILLSVFREEEDVLELEIEHLKPRHMVHLLGYDSWTDGEELGYSRRDGVLEFRKTGRSAIFLFEVKGLQF